MSASTSIHGPFDASARRIGPGQHVKEPFVSLDIKVPGATFTLINIDGPGLDALTAAITAARILLPDPEPEPDEAARLAEVYQDAADEVDRG
jgi:hypothetical protein